MDYSNGGAQLNHMTGKQFLLRLVPLLAVLVAVLVIKGVILGTGTVVRLTPAPELAGAISQSLATSGASAVVPVEGKDYKLQGVHYLDNKTWAVAKVGSIAGNTDTGTLVLQQKNGAYQVVLGPGTAFSGNEVEKLPADIKQYITDHGVLIYEPAS